jgi:hypothetical protein
MSWRPLGAVLPGKLTDARLQLHFAAQLVSAPGTTLLRETSDHQHTNLAWDFDLGVLAGRPVGEQGVRAALVFEGLELAVLDGTREKASRALEGSTMDRSLAWLSEQLSCEEGQLELPEHEMPSHALEDGATFSGAYREARAELAFWFSNATSVVHGAVADEPHASAVRCWPHHFDVASLIALDPAEQGEDARTIGVGFSPGDSSFDQPYFYVTPWPYPENDRLPPLSGAVRWHTEGFTAAVLPGEALTSERSERQPELVRMGLKQAIDACRRLLDD